MEKQFDKYQKRGNQNWREMHARDPRRYNAYQQARYEWIMRVAGDLRGKSVLDLGCGGGSLTYLMAKKGAEVVGVEYEAEGLAFARQNLASADPFNHLRYNLVQGSAYDLPCEDNSFDVVVSCEVIEHLETPERMLAEAKRVLKPGGRLVLTTPYRLTEEPKDPNHVHEFYPNELRALMQQTFAETQVKETHHMFWRALFVYGFRFAGRRPLGKWAINALTIWVGWNPFMIDYPPGKFDLFTTLIAWGTKH